MKKKRLRPGRPRSRNEAKSRPSRDFFDLIDTSGLTFKEAIDVIRGAFDNVPSYRTLQDWRRGIHEPRFAPFDLWSDAIRQYQLAKTIQGSNLK